MTPTHSCFSPDARTEHGRLHLPVAPKANVRCKYDDALYIASGNNEVGKAPQSLTPAEALAYLDRVLASGMELSMVGITGPGQSLCRCQRASPKEEADSTGTRPTGPTLDRSDHDTRQSRRNNFV